MADRPEMAWLRLTPPQTRILLTAWGAERIICAGRDLNIAHRLERRGLLKFTCSLDGGLRGEFSLTDTARDYPPTGLKALIVRHSGVRVLPNRRRADHD